MNKKYRWRLGPCKDEKMLCFVKLVATFGKSSFEESQIDAISIHNSKLSYVNRSILDRGFSDLRESCRLTRLGVHHHMTAFYIFICRVETYVNDIVAQQP